MHSWSGTYCNGLPCGEFHVRFDADHENVFRVENLQLNGSAVIWQHEKERWIEASGRYEKGKRVGRWARHVEPGHTLHSATIYDDNGFVSSTSFYCTNGNRREVRGPNIFLFDARGTTIAKTVSNQAPENADGAAPEVNADDPALCPLP